MAEMNFGPPQMSMTSGPRLTYGTIISSTQLFTQAQWHSFVSFSGSGSSVGSDFGTRPKPSHSLSSGPTSSASTSTSTSTAISTSASASTSTPATTSSAIPTTSTTSTSSSTSAPPPAIASTSTAPVPSGSKDEQRIDSARREWERATPENLRRVQTKDLRNILGSSSTKLGSSVIASASSTARLDFSSFLTGHELTVPLLSSPRLIKRPFDPLICENMILSRATALVPLPTRSASRGSSPCAQARSADGKSRSPSRDGTGGNGGGGSDPWFDSMDDNNTRLALELNLVLTLCQALEGVRSPRLAVRDRQLIVRETATELGIFFDFLEHRPHQADWQVAASLIDSETKRTQLVTAPEQQDKRLPARIVEGTSVHKVPVVKSHTLETVEEEPSESPEREIRSDKDIVTTGCFKVTADTNKFLQLLGKLLKSVVESLDSAQFG